MKRAGVLSSLAFFFAACATRDTPPPRAPLSLEIVGLADDARVSDTRIPLQVRVAPGIPVASVAYLLDGERVAERRSAPWGWGDGGSAVRDAGEMSFGRHEVRIEVQSADGRAASRSVHVEYTSPLGRVPSYERDIAPLFRARCASCHDHGLARDLATYDRLRAMIPRLRASVRERRMPPDFAIDDTSVALFVAWCDGYAPP